jgi:glycosyltransferase involved in cell wall biosynthesis
VDDPNILLVHVTDFNNLMWDNGRTPTRVINHGVLAPQGVTYSGDIERGLVVVNGLAGRGRRLGADVFENVRRHVPLDLVGMKSTELGGLGELSHAELPAFEARYRFFFNPIRYTSLGLAVCEAMMLGMPVVGLATTEMVTAVENGVSGYVATNVNQLIDCMNDLLGNPAKAHQMGAEARRRAIDRFNIYRFISDWNDAFALVTGVPKASAKASSLAA